MLNNQMVINEVNLIVYQTPLRLILGYHLDI